MDWIAQNDKCSIKTTQTIRWSRNEVWIVRKSCRRQMLNPIFVLWTEIAPRYVFLHYSQKIGGAHTSLAVY